MTSVDTFEVTLDDPTYRDALGIVWDGVIGEMTVAQLVAAAADAQVVFRECCASRNAVEARRAWRAMRAAQLVLAFRSRLSWPYHA